MKILLIRHAEALNDPYPEVLRPLSLAGRKSVKRLAQKVLSLELVVDRIISSPLTRAIQTAEILLCSLRKRHPVKHVECRIELASDFLPDPFARETFFAFLGHFFPESLILVGHEPELLQLARWMTPDKFTKDPLEGLKKGCGLLFEWDPEEGGHFHGKVSP